MLPVIYLTFSQCEVLTLPWQIEASKPTLKCKKKTTAAQIGLADKAQRPEKKAVYLLLNLQMQFSLVCSSTPKHPFSFTVSGLPQLALIAFMTVTCIWHDIDLLSLHCAVLKLVSDLLMCGDAGAEEEEAEGCRGLKAEWSRKGKRDFSGMVDTTAERQDSCHECTTCRIGGMATAL